MKFTVAAAVAIALAVTPILAVTPPESFGFPTAPDDTFLDIAYRQPNQPNGSFTRVQPGDLFGIDIPSGDPIVSINFTRNEALGNSTGGLFTALLVDPDAPSPDNPRGRFYLHYLEHDLAITAPSNTTGLQLIAPPSQRTSLLTSGTPLIPYIRPQPPTNSSAHRYIFYLFRNANNFSLPAGFEGYSAQNRSSFDLFGFINAARAAGTLSQPWAATYFYVSSQSGVPRDFVAAQGGSYPGGNGNAVTSGDPGATALPSYSPYVSPSPTTNAAAAVVGVGAMATGMAGLVGAGVVGLAALL